jgi:hypothetical protein
MANNNGIKFHEEAKMGSVHATAHLHDDGTHSLSFHRYASSVQPDDRYVTIGFQLTRADILELSNLLAAFLVASEPAAVTEAVQ